MNDPDPAAPRPGLSAEELKAVYQELLKVYPNHQHCLLIGKQPPLMTLDPKSENLVPLDPESKLGKLLANDLP